MKSYTIGDRLKNLRETKKISQYEVSERTSISRTSISGYESNISMPSVDVLVKLALFYNVSLDYLVGFTVKKEILLEDFTEEQAEHILNIIDNLLDNLKNGFK